MPPQVLIFANPIAGRGRGRTIATRLQQSVAQNSYKSNLIFDRPTPALFNFLNPTTDTVISIGGDGSLRSVVHALLQSNTTPPPVLILPMGTANLMGRHLGIRWSPANLIPAVLATLKQRKITHLDAARANNQTFLLMAGVGIDGKVVHLLDSLRKGPIDITSYLLPTALGFATYTFPPLTVTVDNREIATNLPSLAFIGNVKEYGTGLPILTRARPDDGLLDICILPCQDLRDIADLLLHLATGDHPHQEDVIYTRGKHITVQSDTPVPVQIDGDSAGFTPLTIDMLPAAVSFLLPSDV